MPEANKPRSVKIGVTCLYLALLISFILSILSGFLLGSGTIPVNINDRPVNVSGASLAVVTIVVSVIFALVWWWIINRISVGRNWARILYLVLLCINVLGWIFLGERWYHQGIYVASSGMVNLVLGVIAMFYLFSPSANPWFRRTS